MLKRCSMCAAELPVAQDMDESSFYAKVRHPDGTIRQWQSRCKRCMAEVNRYEVGMKRRGRPYVRRLTTTAEERLAIRRDRWAQGYGQEVNAQRRARYEQDRKDPEKVAQMRARWNRSARKRLAS